MLEHVAARVRAEREHQEQEVDAVLEAVYNDYVTLRRLLVDEGLLERDAGTYRRPVATVWHGLHSLGAGR